MIKDKDIFKQIPLIVIAGPTASGKSDLALKTAQKFNGYIINADSRQLYRDLTIGTAKPIPDKIKQDGTWLIQGIEHYLYGFLSLDSDYNIYKYQNDVRNLLLRKYKDNKVPILVGGTGLYIDSLIYSFKFREDQEFFVNRDKTRDELNMKSLEVLQILAGEKLNILNESDRKNPRRIIRLIESGSVIQERNILSNCKYISLLPDIKILEERIRTRTDKMFDAGLEKENRELINKGYNYHIPSMQTIGYREFDDYFKGRIDISEVKELVNIHTRQYAKRQLTWFKRDINSDKISDISEAENQATIIVKDFLNPR